MGLFFGIIQNTFCANMSVGVVCMVKTPQSNHFINTTGDLVQSYTNVTHLLTDQSGAQEITILDLNLDKELTGDTGDNKNNLPTESFILSQYATREIKANLSKIEDFLNELKDIPKRDTGDNKGIFNQINADLAIGEEVKGQIIIEEVVGRGVDVEPGGVCEVSGDSDITSPVRAR